MTAIKKDVTIGDCRVGGCSRHAYCKGYCEPHYRRAHKHGDPLAGKTVNYSCLAFLRKAVASDTDECIEWPFRITKGGYGQVRYGGKNQNAHRVALILSEGEPKDESLHAAHEPIVCHNRSCVNPKHIRWATPKENMCDRKIDGTQPRMRGERHGAAKLTDAQVIKIRASSNLQRDLAEMYGVSIQQISRIITRKRWRHV